MADTRENIATRPDKRNDFVYELTPYYYDRYRGTAEALIREHVVQQDQLPGQPGRPKTRVTYLSNGTQQKRGCSSTPTEPGAKRILRAGADRFEVQVAVSEEEQARRHADGCAVRRKAGAIEAARAEVNRMVHTAEDYRERAISDVEKFVEACRLVLLWRNNGAFCIDVRSLARFDQAAAALLAGVRSMGIRSSEGMRAQRVTEICCDLGLSVDEIGERPRHPRRLALSSSETSAVHVTSPATKRARGKTAPPSLHIV